MSRPIRVLSKDDSKFCICGQALVDTSCPKCDPVAPARPATRVEAWINTQAQRTKDHRLRSTGFGKYEYC